MIGNPLRDNYAALDAIYEIGASGREYGRDADRLGAVFAAGDVRAGATKRVSGAVGDGALAVRFAHQVCRPKGSIERALRG